MVTKYILAGGGDYKNTQTFSPRLAAEVRKQITGPVKVLSCLFAEPREVWEAKFAKREPWFRQMFGDDTSVELAFPDVFSEQVSKADVVYLHGGDDALLGHYLDQVKDIRGLFADKIVVGSSAGANWLSSACWTCDWRAVRHGAGLVPLNIIVHYGSDFGEHDPRGPIDWQSAETDFQAVLETGAQITRLPEGEFVVFEA